MGVKWHVFAINRIINRIGNPAPGHWSFTISSLEATTNQPELIAELPEVGAWSTMLSWYSSNEMWL
jgi:hypothetical protein